MPLRASSHPGSPNSPSCSALAWYSCWPGLSPWGESWKRTRVARTAALTRYRYATQPRVTFVTNIAFGDFIIVALKCFFFRNKDAFFHDDVMTYQCFPRYWPFVMGNKHSGMNNSSEPQDRSITQLPSSIVHAWVVTEWPQQCLH